MIKQYSLLSLKFLISSIIYIFILGFFSVSCRKEDDSVINFKFQSNEIICYPDKHISVDFDIIPEGNYAPFRLKWFVPDSLKEEGPHIINITSNVVLDFEITDAKNTAKRFTYNINADAIDSLQYDYRNKYIGKYRCNVTYFYNGSSNQYTDTLTVVKNDAFNNLNIQTRSDIENNYEGNKMIYLNSNGNNNNPDGEFFGYHSGASFSNDSIYYTFSGPLGYYYTYVYEGIRINQ